MSSPLESNAWQLSSNHLFLDLRTEYATLLAKLNQHKAF